MHNIAYAALHSAGCTHAELFRIFESKEIDPAIESLQELSTSIHSGFLSTDRVREIRAHLKTVNIGEIQKILQSCSVRLVTFGDPEYPEPFRQLERPPFILYLRWAFPRPEVSLSVVGARKFTPYGMSITKTFVRTFAMNGWPIISGGAYGIDSIAHFEALDSKGDTLAIIGTGIDIDYPQKHRSLFDRIANTAWCGVVSCFSVWKAPLRHHFPIRNALVAAYSRGTLVTEATEDSGSLITARLALEFNKEVFAIPGDIGKPLSTGTNGLIRDGLAKCVLGPEDVFSELPGFFANSNRSGGWLRAIASTIPPADPILNTLFRLGSAHVDTIAEESKIAIQETISILSRFEIEGRVVSDSTGWYRLA